MLSGYSRKTRFAAVVALIGGVTLISAGASAFNSLRFEMAGLDLSAYSIAVGRAMSGTARLAQATPVVAIVSLRSSSPSVAAVPTTMPVMPNTDRTTFVIRGLTAGCADITATHAGRSRVRQMVVHPLQGTSSFSLTVPDKPLLLGAQPVNATVSGGPAVMASQSVFLTSSNTAVVTVPPSRQLVRGSASFPITVRGEGCAIISAQIDTLAVRKTVRSIYIGG